MRKTGTDLISFRGKVALLLIGIGIIFYMLIAIECVRAADAPAVPQAQRLQQEKQYWEGKLDDLKNEQRAVSAEAIIVHQKLDEVNRQIEEAQKPVNKETKK